ncbi:MAG: enoyl-CoA hydratase/isomerase family protein [Deltaproteobacteria bacterium]|nr:enoyl-CoA hydratase/isomerase family protein [Candidatus Zymogenaceae bacterium]
MKTDYTYVSYTQKGSVGIITLDRPKEMNALSRSMCEELTTLIGDLGNNPDVTVVIVYGGTDVFSAGIDINELVAIDRSDYREYFDSFIDYYIQIYDFPKPMIAAVCGIAMGGGFNLALASDFIVASDTAIFAHPEIKFGLNPLFGPLWARIGASRAKEIAMTGEPLGAHEAERIGLVNRVLPTEEVFIGAMKLAENLAEKSPRTLSMIKRISDLVPRLDRRSSIEHEVEVSALLLSYRETREKLHTVLSDLKKKKGK